MKILKKKYPKGTFKHQKTDGRYVNEDLYSNLEILAKKIVDDMTFLAIGCSSTLEVGTGKSVMFTQVGETWTYLVNKIHGLNLTFTKKNVVFRPRDLIERAFEVPKYSCILVDEWEDAHYWSELGMSLRQFFRKCRQLNLFILVIIPNFFQMPMNYAIGRSIFAIDVKFTAGFERGTFDFYNFPSKKFLYLKGKKNQDYGVAKSSFTGNFLDGYGIPREEYLKAKKEDLEKVEDKDGNPVSEFNIKIQMILRFYQNRDLIKEKGLTTKIIGEIFEAPNETVRYWIKKARQRLEDMGRVVKVG